MNEWFGGFFDELYLKWQNIDSSYPMQCKEAAQALAHTVKLEKGSQILDLCCGCGYHSESLADLGYIVTGIDLSNDMLQFNEKVSSDRKVRYLQGDIRYISYGQNFDAIFSFNTSLCYFDQESDYVSVFQRIKNALRPDGIFVLDLFNPYWLIGNFQPKQSFSLFDGSKIHQTVIIDPSSQLLVTDWIRVKDENIEHRMMKLRMFFPKELIDLGKRVDLEVVKFLGNYNGDPLTPNSERCIVWYRSR